MRVLSANECSDWLYERGIGLSPRNYPLVREPEVLEFPIPHHAGELVALAYMFGDMEKVARGGGILVIREWSIGSPGLDALGHETVKRMLGMNGGEVDTDQPLQVELDGSESALVASLLLQSMIFGWDAFYVPASGAFLIFVSHDEVAYVAAPNPAFGEDVSVQFERLSVGTVATPYYLLQAKQSVIAH